MSQATFACSEFISTPLLQIKLGAVVKVSCHVPVHGHGRQWLLVRSQTLEEVVTALNGAGLVRGPGLNT